MIYKYNAHCSFSEMYEICADSFENMKIEDTSLAVNQKNALIQNEIYTVADLLRKVPEKLLSLNRVSKRCLEAVHQLCLKLKDENGESASRYTRIYEAKRYIHKHAREIQRGDFNLIPNVNKNAELREVIDNCKRAYDDLGIAWIYACSENANSVKNIMGALTEYHNWMQNKKAIGEILTKIPKKRAKNKVYPYICAYSQTSYDRTDLLSYYKEEASRVCDIIDFEHDYKLARLKDFLSWCLFDLFEDFRKLFEGIFINEYDFEVIQLKAKGKTHKEISQMLKISLRIVNKASQSVLERFCSEFRKLGIIEKISAEKNGEKSFALRSVSYYADNWKAEFTYLLKKSDNWLYGNNYCISDNQIQMKEKRESSYGYYYYV